MRRGSLKLDGLRGLVLDEADEMLRMGFADDVDWVLTHSPADRQMALFSATLPEPIRRIAQRHLRNPAEITIQQRTATEWPQAVKDLAGAWADLETAKGLRRPTGRDARRERF